MSSVSLAKNPEEGPLWDIQVCVRYGRCVTYRVLPTKNPWLPTAAGCKWNALANARRLSAPFLCLSSDLPALCLSITVDWPLGLDQTNPAVFRRESVCPIEC